MANAQRDRLIRRYARGPARVKAALAQVPEKARKWRPGRGQWSVHEVVCHCADAETNAAARIRYLVSEKKPLIIGYDQDEWAARLDYHRHPLNAAIETVTAVRANTVPLLKRLPAPLWKKAGRHTESGRYTTGIWLTTYAEHLEGHARQIGRIFRAWKASRKGGA